MEEYFETKAFENAKSFGPDAFGFPILIKSRSQKWKNTCFVPMTSEFLKSVDKIKKFKVFDDDIYLCGYPRSGTTFMQEMIWLIVNNFDFNTAKSVEVDKRFYFLDYYDNIIETYDGKVNQSLDDVPRPRTIKSHLPIQFLPDEIWIKQPKLIHICRDPRDVAVSMSHFVRNMFRSTSTIDEFMEEFLNDRVIYCPYPDHVKGFLGIDGYQNILYVTYEWATTNIDEAIVMIANFLGKTISEENFKRLKEHLRFDNMKKNPACNIKSLLEKLDHQEVRDLDGFIRKGIIGNYKNELSDEYIEKFENWIQRNF